MENLEYVEDKSRRVAELLLRAIKEFLKNLGLNADGVERWESLIYLFLIVLFSILAAWLLRVVLHRIFLRWAGHTGNEVLKTLIKRRLFSGVAYIFPPLIVIAFLPWVYQDAPHLIDWIGRLSGVVFIVALCIYLNRLTDTVWHLLSRRDEWRDRPLKGLVQLIKGVLLGVSAILAVAVFAGISPMKLVTGLGAFAAVLMLVFKDAILGFVAGIQLTESGGRRIKREFLIENDSVSACTEAQLDTWSALPYMKEYIAAKRRQRDAARVENTNNAEGLANGTIDTNLGLFRAYVNMYLLHCPTVAPSFEIMARLLEPTANGVPFEIYCFTTVTEWVAFESVQSEMVEHILVAAGWFGLRIYQNASGYDYLLQAEISAGKAAPPLS